MTVAEVAKVLEVSPRLVYLLCETGKLRHHRFGTGRGTIRISSDDLTAYRDGCVAAPPQKPIAVVRSKRGAEPPSAFTHLDGARLRAAWSAQDARSRRPGAGNARSSGLSCDPSTD